MDKEDSDKKQQDFIRRGIKQSSPLGTTALVGLRALDPILQYARLAEGLDSSIIRILSGTTPTLGPSANTTIPIDKLGLSPHRLTLQSMAVGSALKQRLLGTVPFTRGNTISVCDTHILIQLGAQFTEPAVVQLYADIDFQSRRGLRAAASPCWMCFVCCWSRSGSSW